MLNGIKLLRGMDKSEEGKRARSAFEFMEGLGSMVHLKAIDFFWDRR